MPGYINGKLYEFNTGDSAGFCEWLPVNPDFPGKVERLIKQTLIEIGHDHSWEWELQIDGNLGLHTWIGGPFRWNDPDDCRLTVLAAGCENHNVRLIGEVFPFADGHIIGMPDYFCTDAEVQNWPQS